MKDSPAPGPREPVDLDSLPDLLRPMQRWVREHGDLVRLGLPEGGAAYVVASPELAGHVLVANHRNYRKGYGIERVRLLLGEGLMVSEGADWLRHRTMLQPAFHRKVLDGLQGVFQARARRLRERWEEGARRGEPVNVTQDTSESALLAVLDALFGGDPEWTALPEERNPFLMVTREPARDLRFAIRFRRLRARVEEMIERRRGLARPPEDLLAMMMAARDEAGAGLQVEELVDEVMTLVIAGHETTASTLSWIWYLLGEHPEAEAALHRALEGRPGSYPDQVIREALRLYPPGWLITRHALQPDRLGPAEIEAGAEVLIPLFLIHRHPAHWPEPEAFRPERFAEDARSRHPFAYLPFGAGPRRCIGEQLALAEIRCHLAEIGARLSLRREGGAPVELDPQVNLRTREPLLMRAALRGGAG